MNSEKYIINWLNISIGFLLMMIFVGGITRLTDSGLSMVSWKPVTGIFPPVNEEQWVDSFDTYKDFPEYKVTNYNISISDYKYIYIWEYIHRMLGRLIGLLFFIPFSYFLIKGYLSRKLVPKLIFIFILGGFQGFLGWYMVKSGLIDNPHVSHYRLASHLLLAFIILGLVYKIKLSLIMKTENKILNYNYYKNFINIISAMLYFQIIYGAFNAGLKTVSTINTFPFYEGAILPPDLLILKPLYLNIFENHLSVQFIHRSFAVIILILVSIFSYRLSFIKSKVNIYTQYFLLIVFLQMMLGVLTLVANAPLFFASSHQMMAALLIMLSFKIKHMLGYE